MRRASFEWTEMPTAIQFLESCHVACYAMVIWKISVWACVDRVCSRFTERETKRFAKKRPLISQGFWLSRRSSRKNEKQPHYYYHRIVTTKQYNHHFTTMCYKKKCCHCHKESWTGCGEHVDKVLKDVKMEDRCQNWKRGTARPCGPCIPFPDARVNQAYGLQS
eukprot:scaffold3823_cov195-Amphora_coffeaeformis.AAC.26